MARAPCVGQRTAQSTGGDVPSRKVGCARPRPKGDKAERYETRRMISYLAIIELAILISVSFIKDDAANNVKVAVILRFCFLVHRDFRFAIASFAAATVGRGCACTHGGSLINIGERGYKE